MGRSAEDRAPLSDRDLYRGPGVTVPENEVELTLAVK
jgi:hypothetical protein